MILRSIKSSIKKWFERLNIKYIDTVKRDILGNNEFIAIDVGAAIGIQSWWYEILRFGKIVAYEPNKSSSQKLRNLYQEYDYSVIEEALDQENSNKPIYLTNVPTGSSLLKPKQHYIYADPAYFLPLKEETIYTYSAEASFLRHRIDDIDLIKIDTQGTELNILKGLGTYLDKLLGAEFEAGLPGGYEKQPSFLEVHNFMKNNNFELFDLRSARTNVFYPSKPPYKKQRKVSKKIHEVDVLYFKSLNYIIESKNINKFKKLIMAYGVYSFFDEALYALEEAYKSEMISEKEKNKLYTAIINWHDSKKIFFGHYNWFNYSE